MLAALAVAIYLLSILAIVLDGAIYRGDDEI
jgi:hypothetical protein